MEDSAPARPPTGALVLTWTVILTAIVLGIGVALGTELRLVGLLAFLPAIAAVVGSVAQTLLVASWCLGTTIASVVYYPDPSRGDNVFLITFAAVFGLASVYMCRRRIARDNALVRLRFTATAMQRQILPPLPQRTVDVEVGGVYEPMAEEKLVGGDVYDVVASPYGTRVLIGDVQGKGLPAIGGAFSILGAFREAAYREARLPDVVAALESALGRHNDYETQAGRSERFVTALVLHVGPSADTTVQAINCGHLPPILLGRSGGPRMVDLGEPGLPIGLADLADPSAPARPVCEFDLMPGESLLLYTDGLSVARSRSGELYPPERAQRAVHGVALEGVPRALRDDARDFSRGRQLDDMAILTVLRLAPQDGDVSGRSAASAAS
jgi:serine phosphatase RsbU (regulator of sigma subunit)